jgi:hypothetical protein
MTANQLARRIEALRARARRQSDLAAALQRHGLTIREDSTLCSDYIDGRGRRSLDDVVTVMREMAWYFARTHYVGIRDCIRERTIDTKRSLASLCGLRHDDTWVDIDPVQLSEQAKGEALHRWARKHPNSDLSDVPESLHAAIRQCWAATPT